MKYAADGRDEIDVWSCAPIFPVADGIFVYADLLGDFFLLYARSDPKMPEICAYDWQLRSFN